MVTPESAEPSVERVTSPEAPKVATAPIVKEPLAPESALWRMPRVLQTPHVSGVSPGLFWDRLATLFLDNWARYPGGGPLLNLVDKHLGY